MALSSSLFLLFAGIASAAGILMLLVRNPVHSVLFMLLAFMNVAAIFVLLGAEFLAVVQILVYSGAILVLFLFVVMLLWQETRPLPTMSGAFQLPAAALVVLALVSELGFVLMRASFTGGQAGTDTPEAIARAGGNIQALGETLYTTWLLPFEVASVLLLVAAVAAVYLAKEDA